MAEFPEILTRISASLSEGMLGEDTEISRRHLLTGAHALTMQDKHPLSLHVI
jgi:hypothetical protein